MVSPSDLLDIADYLFKANIPSIQNEAKHRSIINRAYYAAFLTARDKAGITSKTSVHRNVIDYYQNINNFSVSNSLKSMRSLRRIADYDMKSSVGASDVKSVLRNSKIVFNSLK